MNKALDLIAAADAALDQVVQLQTQIDALSAARAEALVAFDKAFRAAYPPEAAALEERAESAELACALRVPERTAQNLLGEAAALTRDLPATLARLAAGEFSYRHAQVLIDETAGLEPEDREAIERVSLGRAGVTTVAQFRRRVRTLRERRAPETMTERAETARAERCLTLEPASDGMAYLTLYTDAVAATAIYERACSAASHEVGSDPRTIRQLRADMLVDALLDRDTTIGFSQTTLDEMSLTPEEALHIKEVQRGTYEGIVPTVIVTVPAMTLLGGNEPGTLDGVGPIDPATARKLTAEASTLYRVLTDPHTGIPLSMSRTSYRVPDPLRRWLRLRDQHCVFPGCQISARHSDLDHTRDWAYAGGTTDHDNLAHLSRGHHTLKHHGGWSVTQTSPGTVTWQSFLDRNYTVQPEWEDLYQPPELPPELWPDASPDPGSNSQPDAPPDE